MHQVMDTLLAFTRLYGVQVVQWCQAAVQLIPVTVVSEEEKNAFLQAMASSATSEAEAGNVRTSIEELSDVCRRNKKMIELVQSALQPHQLTLVS
jgi:transportin-3